MAIVIAGAHSRRLIRAALPAALVLLLANTAFAQDTAPPTPQDTHRPARQRPIQTHPAPAPANTIRWGCASACEYL